MIDEKLKKILNEEIRKSVHLILEERRLDESDKMENPVEHEVDRIYEKIQDICLETVPHAFKENVLAWDGDIREEMFEIPLILHYKVISYPNKETWLMCHIDPQYQKKLAFNTKTHELFLSYEIIDGEVDETVMADDFGHEINHLYQEACRINNHCANPSYEKDIYCAIKDRLGSRNPAERCIARLFYYSMRREQDSFIQGLKSELKRRDVAPSEIENIETNFDKAAEEYSDLMEYFLANKNEENIMRVISYYNKNFGYNAQRLYDLFCFRYNRLLKKYRRAIEDYTKWYNKKHTYFSEREDLYERHIY